MSYNIEERIRDHFIQSILPPALNQTPCDYRINRDDFAAMVQRLGAKVERDRPLPDDSVPVFVTLHIAGGTTRVYAAADDTPFGEFRESPRPEQLKPQETELQWLRRVISRHIEILGIRRDRASTSDEADRFEQERFVFSEALEGRDALLPEDVDSRGAFVPRRIAVGDVVRLKTGSDWMTVESVDDDVARCVWFQKIMSSWSSNVSRETFPIAGLEKRP